MTRGDAEGISGETDKRPPKKVSRATVVKFLEDAGIDTDEVIDVVLLPYEITAYGVDGRRQVIQIGDGHDELLDEAL